MNQEEYRRVREIFERLNGLPAAERLAELGRTFAGAGDPLRREVEQLLAAADELGSPAPTEDVTRTAVDVTRTAGGAPGSGGARVPLKPGVVLAKRYRLTRLLGAGGFSQAYLAVDEQLHGKQVVVKIPLPESGESGEWFARHFTDEIRALAAISHPGVVQVLDSVTDPVHGDFFTEQYIEGPTLTQLLKKGPIGLERSARMLERLARALAAVHAKGVVHRDLKPHNILVHMPGTHEERPVLIDFGIASLLGPVSEDATRSVETRIAGTPDYLAPEQAMGRVLPESDIYALGCIAIELLAGERLNARLAKRPAGEMPEQTAAAMLAEKLPALPEPVRAGLARLVSMNPVSRGTAAELAGGLFRELTAARPAVEIPPVATAVVEPPPPPPPPPQPTRRGWIAGACAAAGGAGALAWKFGRQEEATPAAREVLQLQLKVNRASRKNGTSEFVSPVDGVVTQDHRVRLEAAFAPAAFCYVFAESLSGGAAASELHVLFPRQAQDQARSALTVPSTAADWLEFDDKPELLRLVFLAGLEAIPEAVQAVSAARQRGGAVLADLAVRSVLEACIRQASSGLTWRSGENGLWTATSSTAVLCIEGRLQHVSA